MQMVSEEDFRLIGAKKLLLEGAEIKKDESLLIYVDEPRVPVAMYIVKAAKELGIENRGEMTISSTFIKEHLLNLIKLKLAI